MGRSAKCFESRSGSANCHGSDSRATAGENNTDSGPAQGQQADGSSSDYHDSDSNSPDGDAADSASTDGYSSHR